MDYNKNLISGYTGIQLFIKNLLYFFVLIIIFTDINEVSKIIYSSLIIYLGSFVLLYFFLKDYSFYLNLPNQITLSRFIINIFIFVMVIDIEIYSFNLLLMMSIISICLDGIDGYISRYLDQTTKLGEVFDQEVDNFLIFILSVSLIINHDYSYYIIAVPMYRYIFLLLIKKRIISNEDLPYSFYRKFVCVLTSIIFILCNCFSTVDSFNNLLYVIILLLTYSFIKDTVFLYRRKYA